MGSASSRARKLADGLRVPGGNLVGGTLSGILNEQLLAPGEVFTPSVAPFGEESVGRLSSLLGGDFQSTKLPSFSLTEPGQIESGDVTLSASEQVRRKRLGDELGQRTRDAAAARGLNASEAGAELESRTLGRFYEDLSKRDFEQARMLTSENIAKRRLRLEEETKLFSQQMAVEAFKQGRETELFNRQMQLIGTGLQEANIQFNQDQVEFTTNMAAAGIPVNQAMEFMALVQRGDIAAADVIIQGMAIDEQAKTALLGAVNGLFSGVGQGAGMIAGVKLGGML